MPLAVNPQYSKHGKFLEWIEREFGWGRTTAEKFMLVHHKQHQATVAGLSPMGDIPQKASAFRRPQ
jgi:hypothetical protein